MIQQVGLTLKEQVLVAQAIDDRVEELRSRRKEVEVDYLYARALDEQITTLLEVRDRLIGG